MLGPTIGQMLGHYEIQEKLGSGGMGEVYRGRDLRLKRSVAIKVLARDSEKSTGETHHRLLEEARAASALNDPHICAIYEVGETAERDFIVMELVEGQPLSKLIAPNGLPVKLALQYGKQIAGALAHAHRRGVIHRDIKSSNIAVTEARQVKILDFGLARVRRVEETAEDTLSATSGKQSAMAGTLAYMPPEVLLGNEGEERADIWALGVVLYEMAVGRRPFQGKTAYELTSAILSPTDVSVPASLPGGIRHVIERCLEKDAKDRYQNCSEIVAALETAGLEAQSGATEARDVRQAGKIQHKKWVIAGAAALIAALAVLGLPGVRSALLGRKPSGQIRSLAVLPLENLSHDPEQDYFADGMTEALITDLAKDGELHVVSRTSVKPFRGAKKPLAEIARELGVDAIVEGSVLQAGSRIRITAKLFEARSEKSRWADSYERDVRDVLSLQDEVAQAIATQVGRSVSQSRNGQTRQVDPEAYRLYLKGMYHWDKRTAEGIEKAADYFRQAIDRDPTFALGYAGLSGSYMMMSGYSLASTQEVLPKAKAAARKALELDNSLSGAHETLANVYMEEWNFRDAENEFRQALALNAGDGGAHDGYGEFLARMGRLEEAAAEMKKGMELDPLWLMNGVQLGKIFYYQGRYDDAIKEYNGVLEMNGDFWVAHGYRAFAYEKQRKFQDAEADLRKVLEQFPHTNAKAAMAELYALQGKKEEARRVLRELQEAAKKEYVSDYWLATAYTALGDRDEAFRRLEAAWKEQSMWILDLKVDPRFDTLRADPRFAELLRRVGLPA